MEGQWTAGLVVLTCYVVASLAGELTFELADNDRQCFYEDVDAGVKCTLEYQVVTGGHYDVDCLISDPSEKVLYKEIKKQYDTYTWTSEQKGIYKFCFSNEFSTFTHKTVYFDFMVGDEPPLIPEMGDHDTALTQVLAGGNLDVDVVVFEEDKPIFKRVRSTESEHKWTSEYSTDVVMCFLNKFSIVTSKKIWLRFQTEDPRVSPPPPGPPVPWLHEAATFMESSCVTAHENLKLVIDYQTHFRLREAQGRAFAESLNERVNYWSIAQTVILILVGIGQVVVLRSFFTENKKHQGI